MRQINKNGKDKTKDTWKGRQSYYHAQVILLSLICRSYWNIISTNKKKFCKIIRSICKYQLHSNIPKWLEKVIKVAFSIATKPVSFPGREPTKRIYKTPVGKIIRVYWRTYMTTPVVSDKCVHAFDYSKNSSSAQIKLWHQHEEDQRELALLNTNTGNKAI